MDKELGRKSDERFVIGLARAFGGALIFAFPLLMTMEMWWLGFYMHPLRLALFLLLCFPLLVGLSHYAGFEETFEWQEDVMDALVAFAVGFMTSAAILLLLGIIKLEMTASEIIGKISLQSVPASIGALLARAQLGGKKLEQEQEEKGTQYGGEMFIMAVGALFLAFNVAPTDEMVLISYIMTEWHAIALAVVSVILMHAFVYVLQFRGYDSIPMDSPWWDLFLRFTVVGYAISLLISLYILWTFGRTDGIAFSQILMMVIVLAFPGAIGAAAARLIL